jgi:hypothetical protein
MRTKEIYRYISKVFREEDWVQSPTTLNEMDDYISPLAEPGETIVGELHSPKYVRPNQMKKSKGILFSSTYETDSILFLIQTISKNIILHIQDSQRDSFIHFFQHQLSWMERGAIQKIYICHSDKIDHIDDYFEYLHDHYQLSKTYYLGKLSKEIWIGLTPQGIFTTLHSKI